MIDFQAVQATTQVAATNAANSIANELPANIGAALALVPALEWAKRSGSPFLTWVNQQTAPLLAVMAAAAAAAGIHFSFDHTAGTLMITGLTVTAVMQGVFEVSKQWLGQHWIYKGYQAFDTIKSVAVALQKMADVPTPSVTGATQATEGTTARSTPTPKGTL